MAKNYKCTHNALVQSSNVIANTTNQYLAEFTKMSGEITPEFINELFALIAKCYSYLGIDPKAELKVISGNLTVIIDQLRAPVRRLRKAIEYAYRKDPVALKNILERLELKTLCNSRGRETIFSSLNYFMTGIAELKPELIAKQVGANEITAMEELAVQFINTYKNQDIGSGTILTVSDLQQADLNELYSEIISLCEMGKVIFRADATKSKLFAFTNISRKYSTQRGAKKNTAENTQAQLPVTNPEISCPALNRLTEETSTN